MLASTWAGLLALALAGLAGWRVFGGYGSRPGAEARGRILSRRELAGVAAVAEAVFPRGGAIEPSGLDAGIPGYVDRLVAVSHPRQRRLMRLLFFLVEHGTLLFPAPGGWRGFRRFSALSLEQRVAVLEAWRTSSLFPRRLVFTSLRAIATMGYFADPAVLRRLELAPLAIDTPVCEADLLYPPIGRSRAEIARGPADLTPPSDGTPLDPRGPLLAGYAEEGR